jgi:hypothetical protein
MTNMTKPLSRVNLSGTATRVLRLAISIVAMEMVGANVCCADVLSFNSPTICAKPGFTYTASGTMTGFVPGFYYTSVSVAGSLQLTDVGVAFNGVSVFNSNAGPTSGWFELPPWNSISASVSAHTTFGAAEGQSCTVTVHIFDLLGQLVASGSAEFLEFWFDGTIALPGEVLTTNQEIVSPNGQYRLVMQGDGNLVEYNPTWKPVWASGTYGNPGDHAIMQTDGNFVVYSSTWKPLWASGTYGHPGAYLMLTDSGTLAIVYRGSVIWIA